MPRRQTAKVIERKREIIELLIREGELPTNEIVRRLGLTHSQVFYVLKQLQKEGLVREIKRGKVAYWRAEARSLEALGLSSHELLDSAK